MIKYALLFFLFILTVDLARAQNYVTRNPGSQAVYLANPLEINIDNLVPVENFLVVISDSTGQALFLDNRFHLVGSYIRSIDLSRYGKGPYNLCIAKDADKTYTRFYLK